MVPEFDQILDQLAKDVESAVHARYRGELRADSARARTEQLVQEARARVAEVLGEMEAASLIRSRRPTPHSGSPRPRVSAPALAGAAFGWTQEESNAVNKCITAWLPMGGPQATAPETLCIASGRMLIPTWGERERARAAVKKLTE